MGKGKTQIVLDVVRQINKELLGNIKSETRNQKAINNSRNPINID